ncbi:MAG: hypothetical protein E7164_02195 [Firmicutes bacterium]|nr:hypothetical protein [Bacillota bacterium]
MNNEFNMNTGKVQDLGDTISKHAEDYINLIESTTAIVNNLSSVWGGPTYDTFLASYNSNLSSLEELNTILRQMSAKVGDTASTADTMINNIQSAME